jgi:murein DD-endopeptidase MepM/ murein hydrolase activator NlpD
MRQLAPGWAPARRRRPGRAWLLALLVVPLVAGILAAPAAPTVRGDDLQAAIDEKKAAAAEVAKQKAEVARINELQAGIRSDIAATQAALRDVNADLVAIKAQIIDMTAKIGEVQKAYDALVAELALLGIRVRITELQADAKQVEFDARRALLAERLRQAYETDRTSLLETFLSGDSFTDVLTEVGYLMDVGEQDRELARQLALDGETLALLTDSLITSRRETDALRAETAAQKQELDARLADLKVAREQLVELERQTAKALAAQKAAYAKLARNKAAAEKAVAQAAAAQRQLEAKIAELIKDRKQFSNIPSRYNGTFVWPMAGQVTQEFGCTGFSWEPAFGSCKHFHKGIDIAAPMYTPIKAAADGVVVFAGFNPYDPYPKAYIVIIAHAEDLLTWYAHLDASRKPATVRTGDRVKQGEVIGYNGMTGRTTGPHLHWMVQSDGAFKNPRLFT